MTEGDRKGDIMSETENKIQWHPGFVAAMNLEFEDNREDLYFEDEYNRGKGAA